ncbi:MAG TPA: DUF2490 domain-containing protein [Gemmatimonadaceae bacterium]
MPPPFVGVLITRVFSWNRAICIAALLATGAVRVSAQASELWPEIDVYWQPAVHQRTFLELSKASDRDGPSQQGTIGLYQDYLDLPLGYLRGGYRFTSSTHDASYRESRFVGEGVIAVASVATMRLLSRSRLEFRTVNGEYSYRVRERLHLQRVPPTPTRFMLAPYVTAEVYYDSRYGVISRLAGRVGSEAKLARNVGIDVYIARQNNLRDSPKYVQALGLVTKLSF